MCFPSKEGRVQGQPEKEADDLLVPRCSGDERSAEEGELCLVSSLCRSMWLSQGMPGQYLLFYRVVETGWLCVWKNNLLCQAPVMVMEKHHGGGENNTFSKLEEKGTQRCLQVLYSVLLTCLSRCSADVLLFSCV